MTVRVRTMRIYTYSAARRNLASVLEHARCEGGVIIQLRDGTTFVVKTQRGNTSPLDLKGITADIRADEIVSSVHEGRRVNTHRLE
jgi:hypothetical protein